MTAGSLDRIDVVVPARDEQELLPRCLESLRIAAATVSAEVAVGIVVVLDSCTDASAAVVEAARVRSAVHGEAPITAVEISAGRVGAARAAGAERALRHGAADGIAPARHWICTTDADTEVPPEWLSAHLSAAGEGAALALGRVAPRASDLPADHYQAWYRAYRAEEGPVHGANLGVRADVYREAGGFEPVPEHEDVRLVRAVQRLGYAPTLLPGAGVTTSGRLGGRTPGGFAGYLRGLGDAR